MIRWTTREDCSREETEDRVLVVEHSWGALLAVLDGAGGIGGGGRAADLVVDALSTAIARPDPIEIQSILRTLDQWVASDRDAGETTAVVASVSGRSLAGASAGDSSLWLLYAREYEDVTADQHRKRRIGSGRAEPIGFSRELPGSCRLLAGTDGLFKYARPRALAAAATATPLEEAADQLVNLVRLSSGGFMDDLAMVLIDVASGEPDDD